MMIKGVVRLILGGNMKLKRLAALVLTGAICLTTLFGCGAKTVSAEDTIATLGEENVSYGVAHFLVKYQKATVDDYYALYASMYGVDTLWDKDMSGSGSTTQEEFKASAMELLHDMYTLKAHMGEYGVEITAEDEAAIKEAANAFLAANTEEAIEEFGATEEIVAELLRLYTIQAKMYQAIIAQTDREVSDEEANMRGYSMMSMDIKGHYVTPSEYEDYTAEEVEELKATALQMELDLKTKDFEEVAEYYNYEVTTGAYAKGDETLDPTLLTALDELKEGEVSGMIETESVIYFVRIDADVDEEATEENRATIIAERETALYEDTLANWQENDGWTVVAEVLEQIQFHNMFTLNSGVEENESTETGTEMSGVSETVDGTESN